ncbi:MAG: cbb3-type cytochrome c oxidase subunit I [Deltaproteobacteria bacterium]|nr:cbb3-type cytochrome c oxidase subunit I [Deltaproteobacteria bacterium]MBW2420981.1 cbb3-type cytochrome c oxidase subunit I [Deltaproteobacteria bacterium]
MASAVDSLPIAGNHPASEVRTCDTTTLPVCLTAQRFIRWHAVAAVVFLLIGGIGALLLALTRWPAVHLLSAPWYYRILTLHGLNMLIFWMLNFEIAVLYFSGTTLLNTRLASKAAAWVCFGMMLAGAITVDVAIMQGRSDVLMTSYVPLKASPHFYLGIILLAVGTLIGVINFFATIYIAKRDHTYEGSMPLVAFGATAAAIIAVATLLHGAVVMIPTWLWSLGYISEIDPAWYRITWWGLGHMSQQVNVCAMVSVWYLLGTLTVGAKPLNQTVCRGAFLLYILFINLAAAHHLLVDPGVGPGWKIWNTSYAMYLAVLASMIHGFTVPAGIEVAMRAKGFGRGLFGWLAAAPWSNPGFSGFFLSLVIFGFGGGITGVVLGTQQINIMAHNTLRIPGHFHVTVVGGTTLAFMAVTYYLVPLIFQRDFYAKALCRIQPFIFGGGISLFAVGMSFAGSYGVPRRHWDIEFTGGQFAAGFDAGAHTMLGLMGVGGVIAVTGLLLYVLLVVAAVFAGPRISGQAMQPWHEERQPPASAEVTEEGEHHTPGTLVLACVFLLTFAVYYFANWMWLADVWEVR